MYSFYSISGVNILNLIVTSLLQSLSLLFCVYVWTCVCLSPAHADIQHLVWYFTASSLLIILFFSSTLKRNVVFFYSRVLKHAKYPNYKEFFALGQVEGLYTDVSGMKTYLQNSKRSLQWISRRVMQCIIMYLPRRSESHKSGCQPIL